MATTKLKKLKTKTHKATTKRFKMSGSGAVMHLPQGAGNGHSKSYKNSRQKAASKSVNALSARGEKRKIRLLLGK